MAENENQQFLALLKDFDTAMLASYSPRIGVHARPMHVAEVDPSGVMWFITGYDSAKVHEIQQEDHVLLTLQQGDSKFISLSGVASLHRDPAKVDQIWKEMFKVWFPGGKSDPNIALIRVVPQYGEYWDNSGANKASLLFKSIKSYATGTTPEVKEPEQHGQVRL
jgi:general stress protein 26